MQCVRFLIFFALVYLVDCRNSVKSLTESMGQEVIEIGAPIKDLPPGVEEEPSAEDEEATKSTMQPATKKPAKVTSTVKKNQEIEKEDTASQEDEEARIEKELAEIYKDTDYKADSSEAGKELQGNSVELNKPIGRAGTSFKFQPEGKSKADVERFRTSVDEISCARRVTQKLSATESSTSNGTHQYILTYIQTCILILFLIVCY